MYYEILYISGMYRDIIYIYSHCRPLSCDILRDISAWRGDIIVGDTNCSYDALLLSNPVTYVKCNNDNRAASHLEPAGLEKRRHDGADLLEPPLGPIVTTVQLADNHRHLLYTQGPGQLRAQGGRLQGSYRSYPSELPSLGSHLGVLPGLAPT